MKEIKVDMVKVLKLLHDYSGIYAYDLTDGRWTIQTNKGWYAATIDTTDVRKRPIYSIPLEEDDEETKNIDEKEFVKLVNFVNEFLDLIHNGAYEIERKSRQDKTPEEKEIYREQDAE
jgi:hypothetical protein